MKGLITPTPDATTALLSRLSALSDPIRCRVLLLLEAQELTVSELCAVMQLPQSTVSRHLKVLAETGWISVRPEGTSRFYSAALGGADHNAGRLWQLVGEEMGALPAAEQDRARLRAVLARRRTRSREFFSSASAEWSDLRRELFGSNFDLRALAALLDDGWVIGDLGCGTGAVTESLAPFVRGVVAVDASEAMLRAARERLAGHDNVDLREGQLEELPIADGELDAATLMLVLHYSIEPQAVLGEAARAIRPGGKLLLVDMAPHEREEYRKQMGHVWLGFAADQVEELLIGAGFEAVRIRPLAADPDAKGPNLFAAAATRKPTNRPTRTA